VNLVDVVAGRGPDPCLVVSLVERLPDDCMTMALLRGGPEHLGWGVDRHLAASQYDAINLNTRATGSFKGKPPKLPEFPRPKAGTREKKPRTVADLYAAVQQRR